MSCLKSRKYLGWVDSFSPSYVKFVESYSEIIDGVVFRSHTVETIFRKESWLRSAQGVHLESFHFSFELILGIYNVYMWNICAYHAPHMMPMPSNMSPGCCTHIIDNHKTVDGDNTFWLQRLHSANRLKQSKWCNGFSSQNALFPPFICIRFARWFYLTSNFLFQFLPACTEVTVYAYLRRMWSSFARK